jgi:GNAT superfamily N-acetyltransferase
MSGTITYTTAVTPTGFRVGAELFREYARSLGFDLSFQGFEEELLTIDRQYHAPNGALLLVYRDDAPVGCAGIRQLEEGIAELKRMYLRPDFRGQGIGLELLNRSIAIAKDLGYWRIRLDTLSTMAPALRLYRKLGFREIAPYRFNPIEGTVYMEKSLGDE